MKSDEDKIPVSSEKIPNKKNITKLTDYDENGNRILYVTNDFLLQKWNNILIN